MLPDEIGFELFLFVFNGDASSCICLKRSGCDICTGDGSYCINSIILKLRINSDVAVMINPESRCINIGLGI